MSRYDGTACGPALNSGKIVHISDVEKDPGFAAYRMDARTLYRSFNEHSTSKRARKRVLVVFCKNGYLQNSAQFDAQVFLQVTGSHTGRRLEPKLGWCFLPKGRWQLAM